MPKAGLRLPADALKERIRRSRFYHAVGPWMQSWRERKFDRLHNVDTRGLVRLDQLRIDSGNAAHGLKYEGVDPRLFRAIFARLPIRHQDFTFIDFGSGKGRALFLASEMPFRRVVGVEFAPELHRVAVQNVSRFRSKAAKHAPIEPVLADASAFPIPPEPCIFFFHNPFDETVLETVLKNIQRSLEDHPREALIIYVYPGRRPGLPELVERTGVFNQLHEGAWWNVYCYVPAEPAGRSEHAA
jgi:SAM-dependent methyltransferase